jgi:hypothetical protein
MVQTLELWHAMDIAPRWNTCGNDRNVNIPGVQFTYQVNLSDADQPTDGLNDVVTSITSGD